MMTIWNVITLVSVVFGCAVIAGEVPAWRKGGTSVVSNNVLAPVGPSIVLRRGDLVVFEGDSNTAGGRVGGQGGGFPELLRQKLLGAITVDNNGRGGSTTETWRPTGTSKAKLVVLMFGSNDAAPRGPLGGRSAVPLPQFRGILLRAIASYHHSGVKVLVLASPPAGSRAMEQRIRPYREAAAQVARQAGASFRDPADALARPTEEAVLQYDALHLTAHGQQILANWLSDSVIGTADSCLECQN